MRRNQMLQESVIELRNVSVYHSNDHRMRVGSRRYKLREAVPVLTDVNIRVDRGEFVYLIGRVGSGKSTLLKTLYAEIPLIKGEGIVAGYDLQTIRRKEIPYLRRRLGVVFQDYQLLTDRNVYSNLHYVLRATGWKSETEIKRRIGEVLTLVGLKDKVRKMPFHLSGGEQQRLSIARALLNNPEVLLADEPTGNLDPAATNEVIELFRKISAIGCSVVMSTHNIGIIEEYPSRTLRFLQGRVEEVDLAPILGHTATETEYNTI